MVPYGLNQEQFVSMYQRKLDRLSGQAIHKLRSLMTLPIGHGVDEASLETSQMGMVEQRAHGPTGAAGTTRSITRIKVSSRGAHLSLILGSRILQTSTSSTV